MPVTAAIRHAGEEAKVLADRRLKTTRSEGFRQAAGRPRPSGRELALAWQPRQARAQSQAYGSRASEKRVQPGTAAARFTSRHFGCRGGRSRLSKFAARASTKRDTLMCLSVFGGQA